MDLTERPRGQAVRELTNGLDERKLIMSTTHKHNLHSTVKPGSEKNSPCGVAHECGDNAARPAEPLRSDDVRQAAPAAVGALIRSGENARSLFRVVERLAATLGEPSRAVVELGNLLDSWESHLPAGHRSADAPFWADVVAACDELHGDLAELDCMPFASGEVLLGAIRHAALAHQKAAQMGRDKRRAYGSGLAATGR